MSHLWTAQALVEATGGRPLGQMPEGIGGISIDTRTLKPGDAFFAIKGETLDGHDFASAAMAAGAGVLVVAEAQAAGARPRQRRQDRRARRAAGARTDRHRGARALAGEDHRGHRFGRQDQHQGGAAPRRCRAVGKVHASDKSFNNHWGVPLTLARMPADADYAIFEIGMNHAGEIRPLVKMVRPHVALITLIAAAHLGHFRNLDEIATAKAEIFEGIEPGGTALLNRDDSRWKLLDRLARAAGVEHVLGFGEHARPNFKLDQMRARGGRLGDRREDRRTRNRGAHRRARTACRPECAGRARHRRTGRRRSRTRWPRRLRR